MGKYKICVYAISKNESKFVDRWVDSMSEADGIFVFDTGSTDDTVEKFIARGVVVRQEFMDPFRFDVARNNSLDMVPDDFDICICTDIDEIFSKGWREQVEKYWTPESTRARYKFVAGFLPDGNEDLCFLNEKMHIRKGFKWFDPIHEYLRYFGKDVKPEKYVQIYGMQLEHHPDRSKSRGQYLGMLELAHREKPDNNRILHLLAREYYMYKKQDECMETCLKQLALNAPNSSNQRSCSMRYMANIYSDKLDYERAAYWYIKATQETPKLREPHLDAAKFFFYKEKNNIMAEHFLDKALEIVNRDEFYYFAESSAWGSYIYHLCASVKFRLKKYEDSFYYIMRAKDISPTSEIVLSAYKTIKDYVTDYYKK